MTGSIGRIRRVVFGAGVLGALGFGATQAWAGPAQPVDPPTCSPTICRIDCLRLGCTGGTCNAAGFCNCSGCVGE